MGKLDYLLEELEEFGRDENFPEDLGLDQDCVGLTEFFDRKERTEDMRLELKSYKELFAELKGEPK